MFWMIERGPGDGWVGGLGEDDGVMYREEREGSAAELELPESLNDAKRRDRREEVM